VARSSRACLLVLWLPAVGSWLALPTQVWGARRTLSLLMDGGQTGFSQPQGQRARREALWREMEAPAAQRLPEGEALDDPAAPLALTAVRAADDRKALEITALRVSHLTSATSFFVNMAGRSKAQINAIVKSIEDEVLEQYGRRPHRQGKALGGWVCLDYDSVVINIFSEDQREFYGIDKYWAAAQSLDLSDVLTPNAPEASTEASEEDDLDDWELGEDEDWTLDLEDEWSLGGEPAEAAEAADAAAAAAAAIPWESHPANTQAVPFDFTPTEAKGFDGTAGSSGEAQGSEGAVEDADDDDGAGLFAAFADDTVPLAPEYAEVSIASEEDEEAIERELLASGLLVEVDGDEGDDDDADWALGDEQLRAMVERAEQLAAPSPPSTAAAGSEDGSAGDWRAMMAEDGWDDVEDTLAPEADVGDGDDDVNKFFK